MSGTNYELVFAGNDWLEIEDAILYRAECIKEQRDKQSKEAQSCKDHNSHKVVILKTRSAQ